MGILAPPGETRKVVPNLPTVRMEDVGTVLVLKYADLIVFIVQIAGDMITLLDDQDGFVALGGNLLCECRARDSRSNNDPVKIYVPSSPISQTSSMLPARPWTCTPSRPTPYRDHSHPDVQMEFLRRHP